MPRKAMPIKRKNGGSVSASFSIPARTERMLEVVAEMMDVPKSTVVNLAIKDFVGRKVFSNPQLLDEVYQIVDAQSCD